MKFDNVKKAMLAVIIGLILYIFMSQRQLNKIEVYNELMSKYTYQYGSVYTVGYSIPLEIDYIQNDTIYLETKTKKP
jgi:hypothetical protein